MPVASPATPGATSSKSPRIRAVEARNSCAPCLGPPAMFVMMGDGAAKVPSRPVRDPRRPSPERPQHRNPGFDRGALAPRVLRGPEGEDERLERERLARDVELRVAHDKAVMMAARLGKCEAELHSETRNVVALEGWASVSTVLQVLDGRTEKLAAGEEAVAELFEARSIWAEAHETFEEAQQLRRRALMEEERQLAQFAEEELDSEQRLEAEETASANELAELRVLLEEEDACREQQQRERDWLSRQLQELRGVIRDVPKADATEPYLGAQSPDEEVVRSGL